ncbi:gluconokinase [Cohnella abietis]|uniref:Gluconate kinase n=1 Tax=Cohnella abietis TaxID=2507935 RepID=A0A3T1DF48_9BACL|nr:gluconokinase [Cohnella abietis]BBI36757.1 gluconate kinase [Cohnella abietis]
MGTSRGIIGIDIGTTSTKSVIFSMEGISLGSSSVEYPLLQEQPGWAEQEPDSIVQAVVQSVKGALVQSGLNSGDIAGVGISSAMHSLIAVDAGGRPLTRSITWADSRSELEARRIREQLEGMAIYRRTGTPIHPMSPLPKLIWLRENRPDVWEKADKFVSVKEYVLYQLFGEWVVDHSVASATGLLALDKLDWDEQALAIAGIGKTKLSTLQAGTYRLQGIATHYAEQMGLETSTPFFLGASDGALANLGVGAVGAGEIAVTIGTSAAVRMMANKPLTDEQQRTFCYHVADSSYIIGGATNNGGLVLQWLREYLFAGQKSVEELLEAAAKVAPGAGGLLFLPFLTGERAPIYNAEARGTYFGVNLRHKQEHFVRSGLEGVMLAILSVAEVLVDLAGPAREIRASGGFAKSPLWLQMLADILGQEVLVPRVTEASALGAAVLAMQGLGEVNDWSHIKQWTPIVKRLEPNSHNTEIYRELFGIYQQLNGQLPEHFAAIAEFQRKH